MIEARGNQNDVNHFQYNPSVPAAIVALIIWVTISTVATLRIHKSHLKYFIIFAVGAVGELIGYIARVYGTQNTNNFGAFLVNELFLVISPLCFMCADYLVYAKLVRHFGEEYSFIPTKFTAPVFVTCDVISVLMQGGGAGLLVSKNLHTIQIGQIILLTGLGFGLASFTVFMVIVTIFLRRVNRSQTDNAARVMTLSKNWKQIMIPMYISIACIVIRTIYRLVEFSFGWTGPVNATEWYLYVFDTIFMVIATTIYLIFWPATYGILQKPKLDEPFDNKETAPTV